MRILDLFCGAGGAAVGYSRAGFEVVGVDAEPQPHYPFPFVCGDALVALRSVRGFDAIHASPPCQAYSAMSSCRPGLSDEYPALIGQVRDALDTTGLPYVIENVPGAPMYDPTVLCGHMFGLELYRHRLFETNWGLTAPAHPSHVVAASKAGHWTPGTIMSVSGHVSPIAVARRAMGIDWMTRDELCEAIPPAYTEWIGARLLEHLEAS